MTAIHRFALAGLFALALSAPMTTAHAQDGGGAASDDPAEARSATFQAVEGAVQEDIPGGPLLVGAYGVILALVLGYVLHLARLQSQTTRDLARLRTAVERAGAKQTG
jgi:hypothetical protein